MAFIAGKLTLKDTLNGGRRWRIFLLERLVLLIPLCKEEMPGKKASNGNLDVHEATGAGQATSSNLVCPHFLNTRGNGVAFLRFAQLRLESL